MFPLDSYGDFFPAVKRDPTELLHEQPELREALESLREKNVRLFLATNSHIEYMNLIMSCSLGPNWDQLFDLRFAFCQKPGFFYNPNQPYYSVDKSAKNLKDSDPITDGTNLQLSNTYIEGNANLVT